jgi:hypothetical protein
MAPQRWHVGRNRRGRLNVVLAARGVRPVARRRGGGFKGRDIGGARGAKGVGSVLMPPGYAASLLRSGKAAAHFTYGRALRKVPGRTSNPKRKVTPMMPPV